MNIRNFIDKNIKMLDSKSISIDNLVNKMAFTIKSDFGVKLSDDERKTIKTIFNKYQEKEITKNEVMEYFENSIGDKSNSNKKDANVKAPMPSTKDSDDIVEIDTDVIMDVSNQLTSFKTTVGSIKITIPEGMFKYASEVPKVIDNFKSEMTEILDNIKQLLYDVVYTNQENDDSIEIPSINEISFDDIYIRANEIKEKSPVVEVTKKFFEDCGCKINGNIVTIPGNSKYKYDLSKKTLFMEDGTSIKVTMYVPKDIKDYSLLNTYTYFTSTSSAGDGKYKKYFNNRIEDEYKAGRAYKSNSILLRIDKDDVSEMIKGTKKAVLTKNNNEIAEATKFINAVAKTDKKVSKNIIAGDSVFGAFSLKIAAENDDLYDTIYCINNAAVVKDINGIPGNKEQFESISDLKKLNGKEIYFVSVGCDPNLYTNKTCIRTDDKCNYNESYTYTGIELLCKYTTAKVHMIYCENAYNSKIQARKAYTNLEKTIKNNPNKYSGTFVYEPELWNVIARKNYGDHSEGNWVVSDIIDVT